MCLILGYVPLEYNFDRRAQNDCVKVQKNVYLNLKLVLGIHDQMVLVVGVEIKIAAVEYFPVKKY